jgi:hypothetical protein
MAAHCLLSLILLIVPFAAAADILDYHCIVGNVEVSVHVDTVLKTVRQTAQFGPTTEVGEYSDGVYGPIFTGVPSVHQFVRITDDLIDYGGELRGVEEKAVLDLRLATITLPAARSGWCSPSQ